MACNEVEPRPNNFVRKFNARITPVMPIRFVHAPVKSLQGGDEEEEVTASGQEFQALAERLPVVKQVFKDVYTNHRIRFKYFEGLEAFFKVDSSVADIAEGFEVFSGRIQIRVVHIRCTHMAVVG